MPIGDDGYLSPPSSRRTSSEAPKLPSIHELEKTLPPTPRDMPAGSSPSKRDSLAPIPEENPHQDHLAFPPKYPGSTITTIAGNFKGRSHSYPPSNSHSFPPPPPAGSSPHHYRSDPRTTPIARALDYNHMLMRLLKDYEIVHQLNSLAYVSRSRRNRDSSIILRRSGRKD